MNSRFLFIGGTARSGTSILTEILTEDPSICLGIERYNNLLSSRSFTPALFEYARFFAVTPGDTWYDSLSKFESHYQKVRKNFSSARYVGDKIPQLPRRLDYVLSNFPEARIIITLRDIASIARSYEARADEGFHWDRNRRTVAAVQDWNQMLQAVWRHLRDPRIHILCHEDTLESIEPLEAVFRFLEIKPAPAVFSACHAAQAAWREKLAPRPLRFLDAQADDFIRQHARFDLYQKVRAHARSGSIFGRAQKLAGRIKRLVA